MDRTTQQNAAMVEESTAAARSLASEADELAELVARFKMGDVPHASESGGPSYPIALSRGRHATRGNLALKDPHDSEWARF